MNIPDQVRLESVACPLGCPPGDDYVLTGFDRLHDLPGEFSIVRCRTCGLMRTNPRPDAQSIGFYYPSEYGPHQSIAASPESVPKRMGILRRLIHSVLRYNTDVLPQMPVGRLFEVGCGNGFFLKKCAEIGWQVEGLEFADEPVRKLCENGYNVHSGTISGFAGPDETADLLVARMVLEHLHDPVGDLRRMREWVRPGGKMMLTLPNEGVLAARMFGNAWYNLHLPAHLFHYTPETMARVLAAGGWRVERVLHQRTMGSIVPSIGCVMKDRGVLPGLAAKLADMPWRWNAYLYPISLLLAAVGQTGRMTIWATPE